MEPLVGDWFGSKFKGLTEPEAYAVPLIHARKSVLVSSPTGSGKTLTAFLSIINELYAKQLRGELEIGRASCRERVEILVGAGSLRKKRQDTQRKDRRSLV